MTKHDEDGTAKQAGNTMNNREFSEELLKVFADGISRSPFTAKQVAEEIGKHPALLERISTNLDANVIAESIAKLYLHNFDTNRGPNNYSEVNNGMASIVKQAKEKAALIIAERIAEEVRGV